MDAEKSNTHSNNAMISFLNRQRTVLSVRMDSFSWLNKSVVNLAI